MCYGIKYNIKVRPVFPPGDSGGAIAGSPPVIAYSERRLITGLVMAAFIAWKLIVASAIIIAASPLAANSHQLMLIR